MVNCIGLLFAISLVFLKEIGFSAAQDRINCNSNSDCAHIFGIYSCCRGYSSNTDRYCRYTGRRGSCRGRFCLSNSDCNGPGECCVSNACAVNCPSCSSIRDCESGKYCCFTKSNLQNRCDVNCLGRYCSNKWSCGGAQECCRSNVCANCSTPGCRDDHECGERQYCCRNGGFRGGNNFCNTSCVGATCATDSDCAGNSECCHGNKCVTCASLECSSNSECGDGYCCRRHFYEKSRCMRSGCIGQTCDKSSDCGGWNECCRDDKCVNCSKSECKDNSECRAGEYCCKGLGKALCSQSCEGQFCYSNQDCSVPGECCIDYRCTTSNCICNSQSDCRIGQHCCGSFDGSNRCNTSCIGKTCVFDGDCRPGETCTYPDSDCLYISSGKKCPKRLVSKCFYSSGCFTHNDCNVFGTRYYCCKDESYSRGTCNSNCINKLCRKDSDCAGSSECCGSNNKCEECSNDRFPVWVIGVIVGILAAIILIIGYVRRRIKKIGLGTHVPPDQPSQPSLTIQQPMQSMPPRITGTENEHGNGQFPYLIVGNTNEGNETVVPSAPPLPVEPYPSTLTLPPPPSYESIFQKR